MDKVVYAKEDIIVKEKQWAHHLQSLKPDGLNDSELFFSQNRVEHKRVHFHTIFPA